MRKVHVLLLSAFLLGSVLLPVFDSTVGSGGFQARPVAAEPLGTAATAIWAVCTDPAGFVVCATLMTMGFALYVAIGGEIPTPGALLDDLADRIHDWATGDTPGAGSARAQYLAHPNYTWLNAEILTELAEALAGLEAVGFVYAADWHSTGHAGWELLTWAGGVVEMTTEEFVFPVEEGCSVAQGASPAHVLQGPDGGESWKVGFVETSTEIYTLLGTEASYFGSYRALDLGGQSISGSMTACGLGGQTGRIVVRMPYTGEFGGGKGEQLYTTFFGIQLMGEMPWTKITWAFADLVNVQVLSLEELEGERYNTPLWPPNFLDTWDGESDVLLADGSYGALIGATAVPVPDDTAWWEGLFGGLGGKLTGIGDVLQNIWDAIQGLTDTVADIWSAVQALPTTMVTAISAAVVPTESVSERTGDLGDTMAAKAPFAWPVVVFAVVSDLFEGGTDCPTINMGTELMGEWPAVEMEMCVPSGAQTILYTLTDVIAAAMVMVWAYWAYRRMVGS